MIAQSANGVVNLCVVGDERAAVAKGSKVLLNDEAGAHCIAQFSLLKSISMCIDGLCVVLDNPEPMLSRNRADRFHINAAPVKMHRYDAHRARRDGGLNLSRVNVVGSPIRIYENHFAPRYPDGFSCRKEGI